MRLHFLQPAFMKMKYNLVLCWTCERVIRVVLAHFLQNIVHVHYISPWPTQNVTILDMPCLVLGTDQPLNQLHPFGHNVKLGFDIWLALYMHFILYS